MGSANINKQKLIKGWNAFFNKSKNKRGYSFFVVILILSLLIMALNFLFYDRKYHKVELYVYNNKKDQFEFEKRIIPKGKSKIDNIKNIINELICGPVGEEYERLFLPGTIVQFISMSKKGIIYISFNWDIVKSLQKNPIKIVNSIVTTLRSNIDKVKGVKILIDGVESISTFNGIQLDKVLRTKP